MFKRIFFYLIGNILVALGVATLISANLGTGAWDALFVGLSKTFGLTVGTWVFIVGGILIIINSFLYKTRPELLGVLTIFLDGLFLDLFLKYLYNYKEFDQLVIQIPLFVAGIASLALGIAVYIQSKWGTHPMDNLMVFVHQKLKLSLRMSRMSCEAVALILALFFGGPIFIGTVIAILFTGPIMQFFYVYAEKWYQKW